MDFRVYQSQLIIENNLEMIDQINKSFKDHQNIFSGIDPTRSHFLYNFFSLTSPSILFNRLFFELKHIIDDYVPYETKWMKCWLNYHYPGEVLGWHNHEWDYHGYICIDPKKTTTIFKDYQIENEIGNIYIGPGNREHMVAVSKHFKEPRITLGFDIKVYRGENEYPNDMLSLIPI